jgi:hypothetical protein
MYYSCFKVISSFKKEGKYMLVEIFYHVDEFCKIYNEAVQARSLVDQQVPVKISSSKPSMSLSEVMTICIYYHYSGYKNFKTYYKREILMGLSTAFRKLVSYNRFVEIMQTIVTPLTLFLKMYCTANCTGTSFVDSFALKVCHNRRIHSHKVFAGMAARGKTSVDWFFGFKIHLVVNERGEIVQFAITPGNVSDNNADLLEALMKELFGKVFGDKGYLVNEKLFRKLYEMGVQLITKIRKNMKNVLMLLEDKLLLRKRGTIESIGGILKVLFNMEHSRHRSQKNFFCCVLGALAAYCFRPHKPSIVKDCDLIEQIV